MKITSIFIFILLLTSCSTSSDWNKPISETVLELRWGSSFGMCVGHCVEENRLSGTAHAQTLSSWNNSHPDKSCVLELSRTQIDSIVQFIDKQTFMALPEIIGCPDCADGGAAWVEILFADQQTHKVTFEYYQEPESIKQLVEVLKSQSDFLKQHCFGYSHEILN